MSLSEYMTMAEVAKMLRVTVQRAHQLVKTYEIPTETVSNLKLIKASDANKLARMDRPTGKHQRRKDEEN